MKMLPMNGEHFLKVLPEKNALVVVGLCGFREPDVHMEHMADVFLFRRSVAGIQGVDAL